MGWVFRAAVVMLCIGGVACSGGTDSPAVGPAEPPVSAPVSAPLGSLPAVRPDVREVAGAAGVGDPAEVRMPAPAPAAGEWLSTEGQLATAFIAAVDGLWLPGADCPTFAARLDALGTPETILASIAGAPDEPTADVLVGAFYAALAVLEVCASGDPTVVAAEQAELAWQWSLAEGRLRQLES